jgi:UDP-glucose 4-epimerase
MMRRRNGSIRTSFQEQGAATLIRQELGWLPQFSELDTMVRHAWG